MSSRENSTDLKIERQRINQHVANQLLILRTEKKLTQKCVSRCIGVNVRMYQLYEEGTTPMKPWVLHALCKALQVNPAAFFPDNTKVSLHSICEKLSSIQETASMAIVYAKSAKKTAQDVEKLLLRA